MVAHTLADPEKGTGAAMICTFGDTTDVTWWRELNLPVRAIVDRGGRLVADAPDGIDPAPYAEIAGRTIHSAQQRMVELLTESGELIGDPQPITHPVKFFEKGQRPLEIVTSRQWYIRNGGRDENLRDALIQRGRELNWVPEHMRVRYENWVGGLNGDWLISRQRSSSACLSPSGTRWMPTASPTTTTPSPPMRPASPSTPPPTLPPATPKTNGTSPAGSPPTPT